MPFKEATFWYGTILFTTGIYFWIQGGDPVTAGIILTLIGLAMSVYAVIAEHYALPKLRIWVAALFITWAALGYDYYDRQANHPSRSVVIFVSVTCALIVVVLVVLAYRFQKPSLPTNATVKEEPKLKILRAAYGTGPQTDIDVTEPLRNAGRDGLVIPVDNNLVSRDPAIGTRKRLAVDYSYGDGTVHYAYAPESSVGDTVRLVLPEDSEKQKLKREKSDLQTRIESAPRQWRERFINPQWTAVTGNTFVNTTVEMDGKAFRHCRFENVTLLFHGNAPTELTVDNQFSGSTLRVDTDDPAVMMFMQLQMIINKIPGAIVGVKAKDHKGNVIPDSFSITLGANDQQDSLQEQAEKLSDEIREFIKKLGPRPARKPSKKQHTEEEELEAMREHSTRLAPWLQRLQGGWVGRFADGVEKMRYLLAEQGITDVDLDSALRSQAIDESRIRRIADRLLLLSRVEPTPLG